MRNVATLLTLSTLLACSVASAENENLAGTTICVNNESFTADIGTLGATSKTVAQGLYDYFVKSAAAQKIDIEEMGDKDCEDYAVTLSFSGTTGTPRAWLGELNVWDLGAYASPDTKAPYKEAVSVWSTALFGVLGDNSGLSAYLLTQGKSVIDEYFKAYASVN